MMIEKQKVKDLIHEHLDACPSDEAYNLLTAIDSYQPDEIKAGDYVLVTRPDDCEKLPTWNNLMDDWDGKIIEVTEISRDSGYIQVPANMYGVWHLHPDWCTKVDPPAPKHWSAHQIMTWGGYFRGVVTDILHKSITIEQNEDVERICESFIAIDQDGKEHSMLEGGDV